jgi:energy-coupling factor transporter ATP-binding protein EcfA2
VNIIKHLLASANSGEGFVQYFDCINDDSKEGFTFVLKGSPGSGKSTLMRKIGEHFYGNGLNIEFFHCSSDISSLDGVRIKELNVCVVDGTPPHAREVKIPLIDGKIVNLCDYADGEAIRKHKREITELTRKKQACFNAAYPLIAAAKKVNDCLKHFEQEQDFSLEGVLQRFNLQARKKSGLFNRKLFGSALTREGTKNIVNEEDFTLISAGKISRESADGLIKAVTALGYGVTELMDLLNPYDARERLIIEDANIIVSFKAKEPVSQEEKWLIRERDKLLKKAGEFLEGAKTCHKKIEGFYSKNMDFDGLDKCRQDIIAQIEQMKGQ